MNRPPQKQEPIIDTMNREIKFRAWDTNKKCWLPAEDLYLYSENFVIEIESKRSGIRLMQFTGLLDKNGKEIYEGDIVRYTKHEGYLLPTSVGEVIWKDVGYSISDPKGRTYDIDLWSVDELEKDLLNHLEIIGNIYENPKLIS